MRPKPWTPHANRTLIGGFRQIRPPQPRDV